MKSLKFLNLLQKIKYENNLTDEDLKKKRREVFDKIIGGKFMGKSVFSGTFADLIDENIDEQFYDLSENKQKLNKKKLD